MNGVAQKIECKKDAVRKALKERGKFDKLSSELFACYGYRVSSNTLHKIANHVISNPNFDTIAILLDYLGLDK